MNLENYVSDNYNRGTVALEKGNFEKAIQFLKRETYECKELYLNLGTAYNGLGNVAKAKEYFLKANDKFVPFMGSNRVGEEYANALGNLGLIAYMEWDDELSKQYCNRALTIDPLHKMSIWNYSLAMLREYCSGLGLHKWAWQMYGYRLKTIARLDETIPRWDGKSKVGRLVVLTEQGYGDKLMFGRYIDRLKPYCDTLIVQCMKDMSGMHSDWNCVQDVVLEDVDYSVPLCDLAGIFGDEAGAEWLRGKYSGIKGSKLRIAIEWAGSAGHKNNMNRSCSAGYFNKLIRAFPDVEFINVRPDSPKIKGVTKVPVKNWDDSAVAIAGCDLVISVDTSIVHLAGSLGVPCLLMQPLMNTDFRWGNWKTKMLTGMDVESNIWYPSVKVLENPGWDKLMDEIIVRVGIIKSEYEMRKMLGGYTIEEYVEKVKRND